MTNDDELGRAAAHEGHDLPLFRRFPGMSALPFVRLGRGRAPVQRLGAFVRAEALPDLSIKRDDWLLPGLSGSKVRKLEFLLGAARAENATAVVTAGAVGSNHIAATAVCAQRLGLEALCLLLPQPSSTQVRQNVLLAHRHGARLLVYPSGTSMRMAGGAVSAELQQLSARGHRPYFIPFAGMGILGTLGHVDAALELADAIAAGEHPLPDTIYVALGSMGSAVGLALGLKVARLPVRVIGVRVVDDADANEQRIARRVAATVAFLRARDPSFPEISLAPGDLEIRHGQFGRGYGWHTDVGALVARQLHDTEGIVLEGSYTAKAFAELVADARDGKAGCSPLFWHTGDGSLPEEPTASAWSALPPALYPFFDEPLHGSPLQR